MTLSVGSLFSGIGGLDLGLERAGMNVVWQVEKDEYARRVLRKHWPHVELYDDVRTISGGNIEHVDLICGGFPCQDISVAGKGKGLAGERSGLWREFARIVDEVRPAWVLVENVATGRSRWLGTILRDLAAIGYCAEWRCLRASDFGAPHKRDRCFVVAYAERVSVRIQSRRGTGSFWDETVVAGLNGHPRTSSPSPSWTAPPDLRRMVNGFSSRVDRLRCLGNAVVPQVAEHIGRLIMEYV